MPRFPIIVITILAFLVNTIGSWPVYAQSVNEALPWMPKPGTMVNLSPEFTPAHLKGLVFHPENPLKFDFIIYKGDNKLSEEQKRVVYKNLIKYFLASLAVPDEDQWVNLSPYEKGRIIKEDFGKTEMGRDLLAQDYILKQITASLIYPEDTLGKKFWDKVYARAYQQYGTTQIPVNTFNKVWIVPDDALVYEKGNVAYVLRNHLKVMLEEDYLSLAKHSGINGVIARNEVTKQSQEIASPSARNDTHALASQVVREIVLPALEKEVNEGKNFAMLRQVFSGMVLAAWYKRTLKESLLGKIYMNKAKVKGVDQDPQTNEQIYLRYLKAYKKGVYNYIKEDIDKYTNQPIPRKYFSGGMRDTYNDTQDPAMRTTDNTLIADPVIQRDMPYLDIAMSTEEEIPVAKLIGQQTPVVKPTDTAMTSYEMENLKRVTDVVLQSAPMLPSGYTALRAFEMPKWEMNELGYRLIYTQNAFGVSDVKDIETPINIIMLDRNIPEEDIRKSYGDAVLALHRRTYHGVDPQAPTAIPKNTRLKLIAKVQGSKGIQYWYMPEEMVPYQDFLLFQQAQALSDYDFNAIVDKSKPWASLAALRKMSLVLSHVKGHVPEADYQNVLNRLIEASKLYSSEDMDQTEDNYHKFTARATAGLRARLRGNPADYKRKTADEILAGKGYVNIDLNDYARDLLSATNGISPKRMVHVRGIQMTFQPTDIKTVRMEGDVILFPKEMGPYIKSSSIGHADAEKEMKQWLVQQMAINYALQVGLNMVEAKDVGRDVAARYNFADTAMTARGVLTPIAITAITAFILWSGKKLVDYYSRPDPQVVRQMAGIRSPNDPVDQFLVLHEALARMVMDSANIWDRDSNNQIKSTIDQLRQLAQNSPEIKKFNFTNQFKTFEQIYQENKRRIDFIINLMTYEPVNVPEVKDLMAAVVSQNWSTAKQLSDFMNHIQEIINNVPNDWRIKVDTKFPDKVYVQLRFNDLNKTIAPYRQQIQEAKASGDKAMFNKGGIDFNAANLNLQIKRDGNGVPLPIAQQNLENIHIDGLIPVILEIKPAMSLPVLSSLAGNSRRSSELAAPVATDKT